MKNNLFILGAFLCTALFVTSCTDDNKDDDENEGKASIIVGINMAIAGGYGIYRTYTGYEGRNDVFRECG